MSHIHPRIAVVFALALAAFASAPAPAQQFSLTQLTADDVDQATSLVDRQLVVDARGFPHVFFFGGPETLTWVYHAWPPDPWLVEPVVQDSVSDVWPTAALGPDGRTIHVAFSHWTENLWIIEYTRIHDGAIDPPAPIDPYAGGYWPSIAVGADSTAHLVFNTWEFLFYTRNSGSGWSPVEPITLGMIGSIGVDPAGECHVVYDLPDSTGVPDLYYVHGGLGSWSPPEMLADDGHGGSIAAGADGRVHVAYGQGGQIRYRVRTGGSWSAPATVASGAAPSIALDRTGHPYVAYWANPGIALSYSSEPPSWVAASVDPMAIQPFEVVLKPSVALGPDDGIHVSYYSWDGNDTEMWYARANTVLGAGQPLRARAVALDARSFPNPVRPAATIRFTVPASGPIGLAIFDVQGRQVRGLLGGALPAGEHRVAWDGRDEHGARVPAGVYFYRLTTRAGELARKIVVAP